jgi:hypothetical protein
MPPTAAAQQRGKKKFFFRKMSFQRRELVAVEVLMRNLLQNKPPHIEEMTRNAVRNGVMFNVSQAVRLIL